MKFKDGAKADKGLLLVWWVLYFNQSFFFVEMKFFTLKKYT